MKKLFLTSAIIGMFALPTYATTVTGTGTECTEPVLNTDTGPATLQAQWNANTINLSWYDDNTEITPSNNAAGTCTYDEGIILPTNTMTKEGYTFGGWRVRTAQCLPSDFNYNNVTSRTPYGFTKLNGTAGSKETDYGLTTGSGEWAVDYGDAGVVKGISRCSKVGSGYSMGQTGNPTDDLNQSGAQYCWCQLSGFDADRDKNYCSVSSLWVFNNGGQTPSICASNCAGNCALYFVLYTAQRGGLFGSVAQ